MDEKKKKLIQLLTNNMDSDPEEIINIYRKHWEIELFFKQMEQNFPLKYFYDESANAIKIQIWITLIANLLLMVMQKGLYSIVEFLWLGNYGQNNANVLCRFYSTTQKKTGKVTSMRYRKVLQNHLFLTEGACL